MGNTELDSFLEELIHILGHLMSLFNQLAIVPKTLGVGEGNHFERAVTRAPGARVA